jgi:2-polyprenyl-3-methyl-5-hydroxy-6-metoxy-1,4-benzoquinol methylase
LKYGKVKYDQTSNAAANGNAWHERLKSMYHFDGVCPICKSKTRFEWSDANDRDSLVCYACDGRSVPRERALMIVLDRERPDWRNLQIHESSPAERGASKYMRLNSKNYIATQFMNGVPLGTTANGFRCEDLHKQTFANESFDLVVTLDVMEHVNDPELVLKEVSRTLKPGGLYIFTTPTYKYNVATKRKAHYDEHGAVHFDGEPEYHGNPVDGAGSPVTFHYGYDFVELINRWAGFDVEVSRFWDETSGVIGEMTEVYICRKRGAARAAASTTTAQPVAAAVSRQKIPDVIPGVQISDRFSGISNQEWLEVMQRSVTEPVIDGVEFARFPHSSIQLGFNGAANEEAVLRAWAFWTYAEKWSNALARPMGKQSKVLDIGCGWGRITRMFARDVPSTGIVGCDIDRDALSVCRFLGVPGHFTLNKPNEPLPFESGQFSIMSAYSVFTHLPENVCLSMFAEMSRVAQKGCLFVFTVEDEKFLDFFDVPGIETRSERWRLLSAHKSNIPAIRERYANGEYIYLTTNEESVRSSDVYGDALVSKKWLEENTKPYFKILGFYPAKAPVYQAVVVAVKE